MRLFKSTNLQRLVLNLFQVKHFVKEEHQLYYKFLISMGQIQRLINGMFPIRIQIPVVRRF